MEVKTLEEYEIPRLLKLYEKIMPDYVKNTQETSLAKFKEISDDTDYIILVAKEKEQIVGTAMGICCKTLAFMGKNFMVVEDVSVLDEFQGQGIGRKLLEALDDFARLRNCAYSIVVSSGFRTGAHSFYEKMGYDDFVKGLRKIYMD